MIILLNFPRISVCLQKNKASYYLRQVNEVNGGDNAFVRCVSVCLSVCLCVRSGRSMGVKC